MHIHLNKNKNIIFVNKFKVLNNKNKFTFINKYIISYQ